MLLVLGWLVGAFRINLFAGVLGADVSLVVDGNVDLTSRLALIGGTSSCHMAVCGPMGARPLC